jgi:hypothetical protein
VIPDLDDQLAVSLSHHHVDRGANVHQAATTPFDFRCGAR